MIDAEAETELRSWKPMPNGGHDPEAVSMWKSSLARGLVPDMLLGNQPENGANTGGAKEP